MLIEVDKTREVLYELLWQFLPTKHTRDYRRCHGRREMRRRISLPDLSRRAIVILVDELIEFERVDLTTIPSFELAAKLL